MPIAQQLQIDVVRGADEPTMYVSRVGLAVWMQFGPVGGVIGGMIQDEKERAIEASIAPIRDNLAGYSFYDRLEQTLHARAASEGLSPEPQFDLRNPRWQPGGDEEPEALVLVAGFSMSPDFGELNVTMLAQWVKRVNKPKGGSEIEILFVRKYAYSFPMYTGKQAERPAKWAQLGPARMHLLMDEAADQLVDMLVYDFSREGRDNWQARIDKKEFTRLDDIGFGGREIRRGQDWVWTQVQIGKEWPILRGHHPIVAASYSEAAPRLPQVAK